MVSKIFIGIPVKNANTWIDRWWTEFKNITYPKDAIRIVFLYGNSNDGTLDKLKSMKSEHIFNIEIYKEPVDNGIRIGGIQLGSAIYKDFQQLMKDEDYFMLMDCDLIKFPPNLIEQLIEVDADIVAPYPYSEGKRHFYDTWIFRVNNVRFHPFDVPAVNSKNPVIVDSVGTCFLAKKAVFVSTEIVNPYPNLTFCLNAKANGAIIVACPFIEVYHIDLEKMGIFHNPLPQEAGLYPAQGWITSKNKLDEYIKNKITLEDMTKQTQFITNKILDGKM
jgi:GT2 family glycosyltransferase